MRKLPPDDYLTVLAGCNSSHAPLQIITATEVMSLDPETLQRRDAAWWTNEGQKSPAVVTGEPRMAGVRRTYFNSGDGLCVVSTTSLTFTITAICADWISAISAKVVTSVMAFLV